jgi:hypothetical protein
MKSSVQGCNNKEEGLRQRVITELRDQGFDVPPQLQLPQAGFWFQGKYFSFDEVDPAKWGRPPVQEQQ